VEGSRQVDRDDPLPIPSIGLQHLDDAQDSRGIDPELQGTGFGRGALGQREHGSAIGDVEMHRHEGGARLDRHDVASEHAVTVRKERLAERPAEVAGGAGDHRSLHDAGAPQPLGIK
jgi:hypothetical protein